MTDSLLIGIVLAIWAAILCDAYTAHREHQELMEQLHQIELKL